MNSYRMLTVLLSNTFHLSPLLSFYRVAVGPVEEPVPMSNKKKKKRGKGTDKRVESLDAMNDTVLAAGGAFDNSLETNVESESSQTEPLITSTQTEAKQKKHKKKKKGEKDKSASIIIETNDTVESMEVSSSSVLLESVNKSHKKKNKKDKKAGGDLDISVVTNGNHSEENVLAIPDEAVVESVGKSAKHKKKKRKLDDSGFSGQSVENDSELFSPRKKLKVTASEDNFSVLPNTQHTPDIQNSGSKKKKKKKHKSG